MNKHIVIRCQDGFVNQLRLSLAANFLVSIGEARIAQQEWIVNNHNNIIFNKFFFPLRYIQFIEPQDTVLKTKTIKTQSFSQMVNGFEPKYALKVAYSHLKYKPIPLELFLSYTDKYRIPDCIGVHIRTGCKTALLQQDITRHPPTDEKPIINSLLETNEQIFLATDNSETQKRWINIFGDRLLFYDNILSGKSTFDGVYDRSKVVRYTSDIHTIADFFILQQCKQFIGSNESSFSIMINWLRDNPIDNKIQGIL